MARERRKFEKDSKYYIDREEYNKEMDDFKANGVPSERLGELFTIHVRRYATSAKFKNYTYRDEMEADALWFLLKYSGHNWDPDKALSKDEEPNAFAYCTQIINNAFLQVIAKEKKHSKIKDSLIKNQEKIDHSSLKYSILSQIKD